MTGLRTTLGRLFGGERAEIPDAPAADLVAAPRSTEQVARLLDFASEHGLMVLPWGSGTHQGFGGRIDPDIVLSTSRLTDVVAWDPEDLTVVVGAGMLVGQLEDMLAERHQTALLPESDPDATVGGVIAAGVSGWRRFRYGPTRDRILEVEFVTGDGRHVTGGARVVKNVTGFDLPRLLAGSFGSLGVLTSVCLKLWPQPASTATVEVDDAHRALRDTFRPQAILETAAGVKAYLGGTEAEVLAQAEALGAAREPGFSWPALPEGQCRVRVRVPPADVSSCVERLGGRFVAAHGVGEAIAAVEAGAIHPLRTWAEQKGGSVVIEHAPDEVYAATDPWGAIPESLALQRRIKAAFDPCRVMVPGRLPGGL